MTNNPAAYAGPATGPTPDTLACPRPGGPTANICPFKPAASEYPDSPAGPVGPLTAGRLRRRPTGRFGLPIPAMNGRPGPLGIDTTDFLTVDAARVLHLASKLLCGICAEPVRGDYAFLSGAVAHQGRRSPNPPAHEHCLLASMGLCPYIARMGKQRATGNRAAHLSNQGVVLAKPTMWVLGVTDGFHIEVFEDMGAVQVVAGAWTRARYFRYVDGRLRETDS